MDSTTIVNAACDADNTVSQNSVDGNKETDAGREINTGVKAAIWSSLSTHLHPPTCITGVNGCVLGCTTSALLEEGAILTTPIHNDLKLNLADNTDKLFSSQYRQVCKLKISVRSGGLLQRMKLGALER